MTNPFALIQPDSYSYLAFSPERTSLYPFFLRIVDLPPECLAGFQLSLLVAASIYLLYELQYRWTALALLSANFLWWGQSLPTLSEGLFDPLIVLLVAFLVRYWRNGEAWPLNAVALTLGLAIGVRPAGLGLLPVLPLALWVRPAKALRYGLLTSCLLAGPIAEHAIFYHYNPARSPALIDAAMTGKAVMIGQPWIEPIREARQEARAQLLPVANPLAIILAHPFKFLGLVFEDWLALFGFAGFAFFLSRPSKQNMALATIYCGYALFVAVANVAVPRYALSLYPLFVAMIVSQPKPAGFPKSAGGPHG